MRAQRLIALALCALTLASLAACGKKAELEPTPALTPAPTPALAATEPPAETADVVGGWTVNRGALALEENPEAAAAFADAAGRAEGVAYEPAALLGTQVVAGTNYCVLARASGAEDPVWTMVYVYADPNGNAKITGERVLFGGAETGASGGWTVNDGSADADAAEALEKALDGLTGANYELAACLGTQIVAGLNIRMLCRVTPVVPNAVPGFALVTVYRSLDGGCEITEVTDLPIAEGEGAGALPPARLPNPFTDVETLEEAEALAGFPLTVPDAPADHPDRVIRVLGGSMIEVLFVNSANENKESIDAGYRIRKAPGADDISGDYNVYAVERTETVNGAPVTLKGAEEGRWSLALWTADGYAYAVDAQETPLSTADMLAVVAAVA